MGTYCCIDLSVLHQQKIFLGDRLAFFLPWWHDTKIAMKSYFHNIMFKYDLGHKTNVFTPALAVHSHKIDTGAFLLAGGTWTERLGFLDLFPLTVRTQRLRTGRQEESILRDSYNVRSVVSQGSLSTVKCVGVCVCIYFTVWWKQCEGFILWLSVCVCVWGGNKMDMLCSQGPWAPRQ